MLVECLYESSNAALKLLKTPIKHLLSHQMIQVFRTLLVAYIRHMQTKQIKFQNSITFWMIQPNVLNVLYMCLQQCCRAALELSNKHPSSTFSRIIRKLSNLEIWFPTNFLRTFLGFILKTSSAWRTYYLKNEATPELFYWDYFCRKGK